MGPLPAGIGAWMNLGITGFPRRYTYSLLTRMDVSRKVYTDVSVS